MGFLSSLFGIKGSQPKTSTVVQAQKLPEEISPFVKEILGEAQDLYKAEIERGYDPYTGETIAPLTAEEEAAMAGIAGLAGTTTPLLEEALETYRTGEEKFTPEVAQEYMSPYQRAVTDIEKREAERTFERDTMPRFEASAVEAGGLSGLGTRAGVQAAELQRNQNMLLADIEAKGQQKAFQDARMGFEAQKAREQQMATNIGKTGPALFQAGLAEQGALQTVGEQKRGLGQTALDEAYYRFLEEKQFPQKTLADYSGMVYSNPMSGLIDKTRTETGTPFVPSTGQQIMGMGLAGLNVFGMGGGFSPGGFDASKIWSNKAEGGPVIGREEGGPVLYRQRGSSGPAPAATLGPDIPTGEPRTIAEAKEMGKTYFINEDGKKLAAVTREDLERTGLSLGEYINKQNAFNKLMQSVTPGMKPADDRGFGRSPGALGGRQMGRSPGALGGRQERDLRITNPLIDMHKQYIQQQAINNARSGQPLPASVSQQMDNTMRDPLTRGRQEVDMRREMNKFIDMGFVPSIHGSGADVAFDPVTGGSFVTIDGQAVDTTSGLKHGGGLSQLANGGPVVYRATPGQTRPIGIRGINWKPTPMVHGYPASQALAGPPSLRGGHPAVGLVGRGRRASQKQQLAAYNKMQQDIMAKQRDNPIDMYGTASPGGGGLTGLPQKAGVSPGHPSGVSPAHHSRIPVGGAGGGAGDPLSVTDTVTQTIQRLGQNFLAPRESLSSRVDAAQKRLGETKGFSETVMTESFTDYQTKLKTLQKRMNAKNKAKRTEFNEADKKASEEFFAAQEKAIKAGNNADIIAGAMDTANQRQIKQGGGTIAQWLTDIANVGVKGIGTRRKEQGKELRELAKEKYKEARSDRKTNRGEELAEINKESLQDAKNLVDKYGFSKELANMDRATRTAAYAEIAAMAADERAELTQVEMMAKLLDVLGKGKKGAGKQEKFTSELKLVKERVAARHGYMLDQATGSFKIDKDTFLDSSDPKFQQMKAEVDADWRTFLNQQDQSNTTVIGFLRILDNAPSAGATAVPPNTGNYPIVNPGQTGLVKNKIYYSPIKGPVRYTGTGFVSP